MVTGLPVIDGLCEKPPWTKKDSLACRWLALSGLVAAAIVLFTSWPEGIALPRGDKLNRSRFFRYKTSPAYPAQEYFADGMTEALISSLAQIRALRVISRTSVMSFKRQILNHFVLPEIARALKVDGVIEGSVQRENGPPKVMIQLIHGPSDTHLWAHDYERAMTDVLKLQGEMARAIANEIRIQMLTWRSEAGWLRAAAVNPAAHEAYLLGRFHYWKFIIDDHKRAIDHFERATRIDPGYAAAYAGLSLAWQKWGTQTARQR